MLKRTLIVMAIGLLAACETPLEVPSYAEITFAHRPQIEVNVAKITVVEQYTNSSAAPHVETEFPIPPMRMASRWAFDRLKAVGSDGELVFTITEAGVVEVPLEKSTGLTGAVTVDQAERYDARLEIEITAENPSIGATASSSTAVERKRSVAEDVTLNEREATWYKMTEEMAADLDKQLEAAFKNYYAKLLP